MNTGNERRRYFRVDDSIILNYRVVQETEVRHALEWRERGRMPGRDMQNALDCIEKRLQDELYQLEKESPEIAVVLDLVNRKVELLNRLIKTGDQDYVDQPTREVNLSAAGVAFRGPEALNPGDFVELQMVLFPGYEYISTHGKVVDCRQEECADADYAWLIAVDFERLQDEDREAIIQHVLKKQSRDLQNGHLARAGGAAARSGLR